MAEDDLKPIIDSMKELIEDNQVPKNVRVKIQTIVETLEEKVEISIRINKSLQQLEEISDDSNLQAFNRTQVWNLISMLESV